MKPCQKPTTSIDQDNIVPFPIKEESLPDSLKLEAAMETLKILEDTTPKPEGYAGPWGFTRWYSWHSVV